MKKALCLALVFLMLSAALPAAASGTTEEKTALQVIIVPKFEIGEMRGDFPGEAQLFYEKQCTGSPETVIPHMPASGHFYVNEETGAAILVTGSGKTAAALSLSAALSSGLYDYSDAYIVSVGCGGGNAAVCVPGDVVVATAACDYDLGHHVDVHEREKRDKLIMWFPDDSFAEYETQRFNPELAEKAYELIRDCPLRTTELARTVMAENFPAPEPSGPEPSVKKGTVISGDNYWKGRYGHTTANYIAEYYGCADPYAVTKMEEICGREHGRMLRAAGPDHLSPRHREHGPVHQRRDAGERLGGIQRIQREGHRGERRNVRYLQAGDAQPGRHGGDCDRRHPGRDDPLKRRRSFSGPAEE